MDIVRKILEKSPIFKMLDKEKNDYKEIEEVIQVIANALKNYNQGKELEIGIVGEVKSGKSTLINALVGEEVSPVGITETTGSVIKFRNNNEKSYIQLKDNTRISGTYKNIKERVKALGSDYNNWEDISIINFDLKNEFLGTFTLVDTPGLQTLNKRAEKITEEIFERIDLVIWVFNYTHYDQNDIQNKLEEFIEKYPKPLIAVINKTENVLDKKSLIEDFKNKFLYFSEIENVIPISALDGFLGKVENDINKLEESGINNVINHLQQIKNNGAQKVKYEKNKDFIYGLVEKYIDFHNKILKQIVKMHEKIQSDLKQEELERDLLLDILKSKSRKFSLFSSKDIFEKEINQINTFVDSIEKEDLKNNNFQKQIEEKLSQTFNDELLASKLEKYINEVLTDIKVEIENIVTDSGCNEDEQINIKTDLEVVEESIFMGNLANSIGIAGMTSTAPAFFQAVLGSQAASVTFFGALPQFILPGIAIGVIASFFLDLNIGDYHSEIKKELDESYNLINEEFKNQLEMRLVLLEEKLDTIYKKNIEHILSIYDIRTIKELEITISQIEKFLSKFDKEKIIETLLPKYDDYENNIDRFVKKFKMDVLSISDKFEFTESFLDTIRSFNSQNIHLLKIELEQKIIELEGMKNNLVYIRIDEENKFLLIKKRKKYELNLINYNNAFFNEYFHELNNLEQVDFLKFYELENMIKNNNLIGSFNSLVEYLESKFEILNDIILYENIVKDSKEINLQIYLSYYADNYSTDSQYKLINELIEIYIQCNSSRGITKSKFNKIRDYYLKEGFSIEEKHIEKAMLNSTDKKSKVTNYSGENYIEKHEVVINPLTSILTLGASTRVKSRQIILEKLYNRYRIKKSKMDRLNGFVKKNLNQVINTKKNAIVALRRTERLFSYLTLSDYKTLENPKNKNIKTTRVRYVMEEFGIGHAAFSASVGAAGGIATSFGAYSLVSLFGFASTGTYIGSLSGAALHNATMAALGGGSLVTGGGGMAAGAVTLGWIFAVPAIAITGFTMHSLASSKVEEIENKILDIENALKEVDENLEMLNNFSVDVYEMYIEEYVNELKKLTKEFIKCFDNESRKVFKYGIFSKAYKYFRKFVLKKNFYTESDLVSISIISKKAEELIEFSNLQINKVNEDMLNWNQSNRKSKIIKKEYKLKYEKIKQRIVNIKGHREKAKFTKEFEEFIDGKNISRNIPTNMIYQLIVLYFITKERGVKSNRIEKKLIKEFQPYSPLDSIEKIHKSIEEIRYMNSHEYSQIYWLCKENFEWLFEEQNFNLETLDN